MFSFTPVEGKEQDYRIVSVLKTDKYADYYSFTDYGNEKDYYGVVEKILSHSKFQSKAAKKMKKEMDERNAEAFFRKYKFVTLSTCRTMDGRDKRLMVMSMKQEISERNWRYRQMEAEKNEERNDEKMRIDIERNTDSEKRLMGYITAIAESRDQ